MSIPTLCIARPVATTLLTAGIVLAGFFAYLRLPVSPLPQVDYPTISVSAQLPGASPDTVATSVAAPLERYLGRIADVTEMTSSSSTSQARITLQFDLDRDIDGAARDVQAAINAAQADVSSSLTSNPTYRKINPSDAPILVLALTSPTMSRGQLYDAASNVLQQRLSQLDGVGQVQINGSALPAVRVELNAQALFHYGIGLEDVRAALASANANSPKGTLNDGNRRVQIYTNDQATHAADYRPLVVAYRNGAAVRLSDIGDVQDSVQDVHNAGVSNGQSAILVIVSRQPGANIIDTVDQIKAELPHLQAAMPHSIGISIVSDRSQTIRASLNDTRYTLLLAVLLVTGVVFVALSEPRAAIIPAVVVPTSIIGTFGGMYLLGFSLDNLSLMALTIATGFVVDDAIVVLENISRYIEQGMSSHEAARRGAHEIAFTVVSISVSLIAVFIPILLLGGIVGRLFREFTLTLSLAIVISMVISLTTTPMMCALLLRPANAPRPERRRVVQRRILDLYERSLRWSLSHAGLVMLVLAATVALTIVLYVKIPKGFFPQEDSGQLTGGIVGDQSISFDRLNQKLREMTAIVQTDPAVQDVVGSTGTGSGGGASQTNTGTVYVMLKPLSQRHISADRVIARLRTALANVPGGRLFLQSTQDVRVGARQANAEYQYTLLGDNAADIYRFAPKFLEELKRSPVLADVNSDQQQNGVEDDVTMDRDTAARLSSTPSQIDSTLYDAFGQRQVSTIYSALNQYHVVMEANPPSWMTATSLGNVFVSTSGGQASATTTSNAVPSTITARLPLGSSYAAAGSTVAGTATTTSGEIAAQAAENAAINAIANSGRSGTSTGAAVSTGQESMVPLPAMAKFSVGKTPLAVNHQGLFVATTLSFNLQPGASLSDAQQAVREASRAAQMPPSIHGSFAGTAQLFEQTLADEKFLIAAALVAVYVVLGILYESFVHPITILSTLPSAGIGALLALILFNTEFSIIALIGVILLIGIVKKNAIMMIDFALHAQRTEGLSPDEAILQACLLRFRPIMMTTLAAILGAVPLTLALGTGAELRQPLGISIVGGLVFSQLLTLYTTPVLYLWMERLRGWGRRASQRLFAPPSGPALERES
jgi:multidrug efflux pump